MSSPEKALPQRPNRIYLPEDVAQHHTGKDLWVSYNGKVYDISSVFILFFFSPFFPLRLIYLSPSSRLFAQDHPGGDELLLKYAGRVSHLFAFTCPLTQVSSCSSAILNLLTSIFLSFFFPISGSRRCDERP